MMNQVTTQEPRRPPDQAEKREIAREAMIADVMASRKDIEAILTTYKVDFDFFLAGLKVSLMKLMKSKEAGGDPEFFDRVTPRSFMEANMRIAMNGLIPDGKEAAVGRFGDQATAMFMRGGFVKVLWRTGVIKSINDNIVTKEEYDTGKFEYEEGDAGFIRHKPDLMRKDTDPVVAAYCVIELTGGGVMREVVPKDELDKIAKKSKGPARQEWQHQMHRKAAIRRIMGKMPQEAQISQLLAHDDEAYDLTRRIEDDTDKPIAKRAVFGNRAATRAKEPAPVEEKPAEAEVTDDVVTVVGDAVTEDMKGALEILAGLEDGEEITEFEGQVEEQPWWVDLMPEQRTTIFDAVAARRKALEAAPEAEEQPAAAEAAEEPTEAAPVVLRAIIATSIGIRPYEEATAWFGDISTRLKNMQGDVRLAFWKKNLPFVLEARDGGYDVVAQSILDIAAEVGLPVKADG